MLSFDDKRWQNLAGGYREKFDPRPQLSKLLANNNTKLAWHELWEGLHQQGDVGEASYPAAPHLVRIYRERRNFDWNRYAIVGVIELARDNGKNPKVPKWLEKDYFQSIRDLAEIGATEVLCTKNHKRFGQYSAFLRFSRAPEPTRSSSLIIPPMNYWKWKS
jgi:hypothetical protein